MKLSINITKQNLASAAKKVGDKVVHTDMANLGSATKKVVLAGVNKGQAKVEAIRKNNAEDLEAKAAEALIDNA